MGGDGRFQRRPEPKCDSYFIHIAGNCLNLQPDEEESRSRIRISMYSNLRIRRFTNLKKINFNIIHLSVIGIILNTVMMIHRQLLQEEKHLGDYRNTEIRFLRNALVFGLILIKSIARFSSFDPSMEVSRFIVILQPYT